MTYQSSILCLAVMATAVFAAPAAAPTNAAPAKPADKMAELFGDPVIARGQGFEIKRSHLDSAMIGIRSATAARGQNIPPDYMPIMERRVLEQLMQIQMLLQKATDADKTYGRQEADARIASMLKSAGSQEMYNLQLKSVGLTEGEMRARLAEEATAEVVLQREMKVDVTDAEVKKFYDDFPSRFEEPEKVRVAQVFKSNRDSGTGQPLTDAEKEVKRKQLEGVLKRARAGEDFAKLARELSDDTNAAKTGGEIPPFPRDSMLRTPEFEAAAFSLGTNQVSEIVTTQYGYHIIKLLEKMPARKIPLATVAGELKEGLRQQEMLKLMPEFTKKLMSENKTEILDEKIKAISIPSAPPTLGGAAEGGQ